MAERDPRTVFLADNRKLADAVIQLLSGAGIGAEIVVPTMQTESEPITGASEVVWQRNELEIRVLDETQAEGARELLNSAVSKAALRAAQEKRANRTGMVTAVCEDCSKSSEWPASAMGTTETCPHCTRYMDIPDPDDDWSGVDFGEGEEDAREAE